MNITRYNDAVRVATRGGFIQTLVDACIASMMAETYRVDAVQYHAKFRRRSPYLEQMAAVWSRFAAQLCIRWLTLGLFGADEMVFKQKGDK